MTGAHRAKDRGVPVVHAMAGARRPARLGEGRRRAASVGSRFLFGMCCAAVMAREGLVDAQPNPLRQCCPEGEGDSVVPIGTTLEATQGQIDGFFSQLPYKCHQNRVASVGD